MIVEMVLHLFIMSTFGTWSRRDMPQIRRKQFIWKTAKGVMCFARQQIHPDSSIPEAALAASTKQLMSLQSITEQT